MAHQGPAKEWARQQLLSPRSKLTDRIRGGGGGGVLRSRSDRSEDVTVAVLQWCVCVCARASRIACSSPKLSRSRPDPIPWRNMVSGEKKKPHLVPKSRLGQTVFSRSQFWAAFFCPGLCYISGLDIPSFTIWCNKPSFFCKILPGWKLKKVLLNASPRVVVVDWKLRSGLGKGNPRFGRVWSGSLGVVGFCWVSGFAGFCQVA